MKLIFAGTSDTLQNVGGVLLLLRNTRIAEREADLRAFELLQAARISAKPLGAFFERMDKKEGGSELGKIAKAYEILSSHPALDERARNARNAARLPDRADHERGGMAGDAQYVQGPGARRAAKDAGGKAADKPASKDGEKK